MSFLNLTGRDFVHANTHDRAMIDEEDTDDEEDESDVEAQKLRPIAISAKDKGKGKAIDPASTKSSEHYDDSGSTTEDEDTADEGDLDRESTTDPVSSYARVENPHAQRFLPDRHLQWVRPTRNGQLLINNALANRHYYPL